MSDTLAGARAALSHADKAFPSADTAAAKTKTPAMTGAPSYSGVKDYIKKKLQEPVDNYHKDVKDVEAPGTAQGIEDRNKQLHDNNN